ncbi:MAG: hypothetical protein AAGB06_05025, partial [Verrucomicrobiota bacterium]
KDSPLGHWIAERSGLKMVSEIGYPTPGSFGSWCAENDFHVITYELPGQSVSELQRTHLPILIDLLLGGSDCLSL